MVYNLINENGNPTVNQFIIKADSPRATIFQSYQSTIAKWQDNKLHLSTRWDYSNTTSKYLYQFIREFTPYYVRGKKDVLKAIESGKFVVDLKYNETVI